MRQHEANRAQDKLKCKKGHPLVGSENLQKSKGWDCSECKRNYRGLRLVCNVCSISLCSDCMQKQAPPATPKEQSHLLPLGVAWIMPELWKTSEFLGGWRVIGPLKDWRIIDKQRRIGEGKRFGSLLWLH